MNKDQLKDALKVLKKNGITVTAAAEKLSVTQTYISDITGGRKEMTKNFSQSFQKEFANLLPQNLLDDEIIIKTDAGNIIERLIGLEAWANVLESQLISWASKMGDDPGALMMRLKRAKDQEMERLTAELRRKKK